MADGFRARAAAHDLDASFPAENFAELRAAGLLTLTVPEQDGGHGLWWGDRFRDYYQLLEELARIDCSTAQLLQVHCHATGYIFRHARPEQRGGVLREIVEKGRLVASVGSETNPRSARSGDYSSELTPDGDGWRLTCHKFFASLAPAADYLLLWVAVPGDQPYPERTVTVLVPRDAAGVELIDQWDVMGMRPTVSWGVKIEDHRVEPEMVFGAPGRLGAGRPAHVHARLCLQSHLGAAQARVRLRARVRARAPVHGNQRPHPAHAGRAGQRPAGTRAAVYAAADVWEPGDTDRAELESIKALHLAKRAVLETTRRAFDVCGARRRLPHVPAGDDVPRRPHVHPALPRRADHARAGHALISERFAAKRALDSSELPARNA